MVLEVTWRCFRSGRSVAVIVEVWCGFTDGSGSFGFRCTLQVGAWFRKLLPDGSGVGSGMMFVASCQTFLSPLRLGMPPAFIAPKNIGFTSMLSTMS